MLPFSRRVHKDLFPEVLKKGAVFHSAHFSMRVAKIGDKDSKFSVVVSKKVEKKAVGRNKIKRRVRGIIEKNLSEIKKGCAVVIFAKAGTAKLSFKQIEEECAGLLKSARLI